MANIFYTNSFPYLGYIFALLSVLPHIFICSIFKPNYKKVKFSTLDRNEKIFETVKNILYVINLIILVVINNKLNIVNVNVLFGIALFFIVIYYEMFLRYVFKGKQQKILYKRFMYIRIPLYIAMSFSNLFFAIWSKNIVYIIAAIIFAIVNIYVENGKYMKYFTEYRELYGKNKKKTGKKMLKDAIQPKGLKYITCAVIIYNPKTQKFLMQKRTKDKGGKWATTSGHPIYGQTSVEGMQTEIKEEIGLDVNADELEFVDTIERKEKYVDLYYLEGDYSLDSIIMQKDEVDDVKWMSRREIENLHSANKYKETHYNYFIEVVKSKKIK